MNRKLLPIYLIFLTMIASVINNSLASAQESDKLFQKKAPPRIVFVPPKDAQPKYTTGGASRNQDKCPSDLATNPYLTALVPQQNRVLTTKANPQLLVYLPATSAQKAFFSLREVNSDNHYQTFLPLQQTSGVIAFDLPDDAPALEVGKTYEWSFVIICDRLLKPDSPRVEGTISRVSLSSQVSQQLKKATLLEQAILYGETGVWYDSVANLAQVYAQNPEQKNLLDLWQSLLTSDAVGLDAIVEQPILNN